MSPVATPPTISSAMQTKTAVNRKKRNLRTTYSICLPCLMQVRTIVKSSLRRIISAESLLVLVPCNPIENETFDAACAGASFVPSPTKATT